MADDTQSRAGQPTLVTLSQTGRFTGPDPKPIRALVRRGRLTARRGNDGRLLIELPADMLAEHEPADRPDLAGHVADLEMLVGELREELLAAKLTIGRLEAERDAGKAIAANETQFLREVLERERARVDALDAELRDLRRPWWRRLLG